MFFVLLFNLPLFFRSMPFLVVVTTFSVILWKLFGDNRSRTNKVDKQIMKKYREEFVDFFPTILSILINRKASHPRVKIAYGHLEEVSCLVAFVKVVVTK